MFPEETESAKERERKETKRKRPFDETGEEELEPLYLSHRCTAGGMCFAVMTQ